MKVPRIILFRASEKREVHEEQNEVVSEIHNDPTWGWSQFSDNVLVHTVPGDHITMMTQPHVPVLAEQLKSCVEQAFVLDERT